MATIYASAPGTGSGGDGSSGSPYTGIHNALNALFEEAAGSTLVMNTGVYTPSMSWNTITWNSGTALAPYTIRPVTFTADTTMGIPGGTTSVIWRTGGGTAINFGVNGPGYIQFYGIDFDATSLLRTSLSYISHNYNANNIQFRNCHFSHRGQTSHELVQHVEYANSGASTSLRNNSILYCLFDGSHGACSHDVYCRSAGNVFKGNEFTGSHAYSAIQFFASNGSGYAINDNIVAYNIFRDYPDTVQDNAIVLTSLNVNRTRIYANEFRDSPTRIAIDLRGGSGIVGAADGNTLAYNTIVGCAKGISIGTAVSGFTGTVVKNNIAYGNGASAADNYYNNGSGTVASNNGFDGTDPKFTNAAADDYTLNSGTTPYATSGVALGSPYDDQDILGIPRPQNGTPSLGAYEVDEGLTPVPPVNNYANPGGYTVTQNVATVLPGLSVTDNNSPSPLLTEVWLSLEGTNATFSDIDMSDGGTSH